jgi:hypothetical protein
MLTALAEDVAEHGGQPISVEPLPQPTPAPDPDLQTSAAGSAPVPAVSRVTLLEPDSVSSVPAVPSSTAVPAVHVTPIPVAAGGVDGGAGADRAVDGNSPGGASGPAPNKVSGGVSVTAIPDDAPAAAESSAEDTSTQSIAVVQAAAPAREQARAGTDTVDPPEAPAVPAEDTSTTALTVVETKSR